MKYLLSIALASAVVFAMPVITVGVSEAAAKKISDKEKARLRKLGWEWCRKAASANGYVVRVTVSDSGRIRCWYKS
jgi:hypothetical protein